MISEKPCNVTFLLTSDVHSALEAQIDKRIFDPINTTNSYPSLNGQIQQRGITANTPLGGSVRLANWIDTQRSVHHSHLLLDAGDRFSGTEWFRVLKGELDVEIMNRMKYHAMAIGNHDFELGYKHLKGLSKKVNFTLLCSNIFKISKKTGTPKQNPIMEPYKIFDVEGGKVAIIGIMSKGSWEGIAEACKENLEFRDPDTILPELFKQIPKVNYVVLLSHSGIEADRLYAQKYPEVNAILGGHSHTTMDKAELVGKTHILHPAARGRIAAKLIVNGEKVESSVELLDPSWDFEPQKMSEAATQIKSLLKENYIIVKREFEKVVANCTESISSRDKQKQNTDLGKLLCEMLCSVQEKADETTADIALISSGSIRQDELPEGPITLGHIVNMFIDGPVQTITATGSWIENIMAVAESRWCDKPNKQIQYGGIEKLNDGSFLIRGKPLVKDQLYSVRGLEFFFGREDMPKDQVKNVYDHEITIFEMMTIAFEKQKVIKKI